MTESKRLIDAIRYELAEIINWVTDVKNNYDVYPELCEHCSHTGIHFVVFISKLRDILAQAEEWEAYYQLYADKTPRYTSEVEF
jgi:hypothetical protein